MLYLNCTKLWHLECGKMNETTDRGTDHDAKRQTQHMANVLRADTMHVAVVHQAAVDVWCVLCTFCLWRQGCCSACMLSLCPCLRSACGSPEDLGDLPSYAAARPTRCPLKRMFMTYTLLSLARCAHPCEVVCYSCVLIHSCAAVAIAV